MPRKTVRHRVRGPEEGEPEPVAAGGELVALLLLMGALAALVWLARAAR